MSASTEVQRTLVKSPPELWAELSDPAALARHLSGLGDVRITRTEPERAVDWEATADDGTKASGRVEISPTGWGTRVTFSATRAAAPAAAEQEHPAPEADPPPQAAPFAESPSPYEADPLAATDPLAESPPPADADPLAETEPSAESPPPAHAGPLAETEPFADDDPPGDDDPIDDPFDEDDPLDEDDPEDPYSDDDPYRGDEPDDEDGVLVRADIAIARARDHVPGLGRQPQPEPRRGLFARLFGLGRHPAPAPPPEPEPSEAAEATEPPYESSEDIAGQLPPPELPSSVAMAEQVTLSYESAGAQPPVSDPTVEPLPRELAALDAATLQRARAAEEAAGAGEVADPARAQAAAAQPEQLEAAPAEPAAPASGPTNLPGDIADELRIAEEAGVEQVTAVLTTALDRLGSAHHRPFSRG